LCPAPAADNAPATEHGWGNPEQGDGAGVISPSLLEDVVNYRDCFWNIEAT